MPCAADQLAEQFVRGMPMLACRGSGLARQASNDTCTSIDPVAGYEAHSCRHQTGSLVRGSADGLVSTCWAMIGDVDVPDDLRGGEPACCTASAMPPEAATPPPCSRPCGRLWMQNNAAVSVCRQTPQNWIDLRAFHPGGSRSRHLSDRPPTSTQTGGDDEQCM